MPYGLVRSTGGVISRAANFAKQYSAIREGIKLGRQMSKYGSWGDGTGRSSFARAGTFVRRPTPPNSPRNLKRGRSSQGGYGPSKIPKLMNSNVQKSYGGSAVKRRGKRPSKFRKKSFKRGRKRANPSNGIQSRVEVTQKVADLEAVYVGHSTVAPRYTHTRVAEAIAKAFLIKEGPAPRSLTEAQSINIDSRFRILYYSTPTSTSTAFLTSPNILAGSNFTTIATALSDLLNGAIAVYDKSSTFVKLQWFSDPAVVGNYRFFHEFNMSSIHLTGGLRSMFSMQNATPNAVGTSSTDVNNNNPLRITKYFGSGNGTFWRNRTDTTATYESFLADHDTSAISVKASEATNKVLDEPPNSKFFIHAKKGPTFILQPGDIKTTSLYTPINMSLTRYIQQFHGYPVDDSVRLGFGKFSFYGCEKVLSTNVASAPSNVKVTIDYEIDYACNIQCTMKKGFAPTAPINTNVVLVDKV